MGCKGSRVRISALRPIQSPTPETLHGHFCGHLWRDMKKGRRPFEYRRPSSSHRSTRSTGRVDAAEVRGRRVRTLDLLLRGVRDHFRGPDALAATRATDQAHTQDGTSRASHNGRSTTRSTTRDERAARL